MVVSTLIGVGDDYQEKYGFFDPEKFVFKAKRGLTEEIVKEISWSYRGLIKVHPGIRLAEAETMIVNGLIQLEMEGSVG